MDDAHNEMEPLVSTDGGDELDIGKKENEQEEENATESGVNDSDIQMSDASADLESPMGGTQVIDPTDGTEK